MPDVQGREPDDVRAVPRDEPRARRVRGDLPRPSMERGTRRGPSTAALRGLRGGLLHRTARVRDPRCRPDPHEPEIGPRPRGGARWAPPESPAPGAGGRDAPRGP